MKINIELKVDLPTFKLTLTSEAENSALGETIESMLEQIEKVDKRIKKLAVVSIKPAGSIPTPTPQSSTVSTSDDPISRIAMRLEIDEGQLRSSELFGIKGDSPQIFKSGRFSSGDALLVLAFLFEVGLGNSATPFEKLKEAFQASHIKAKSPFVAILSNKLRDGHIDKGRYDAQSEVVLTPKGEKVVKKTILDAVGKK